MRRTVLLLSLALTAVALATFYAVLGAPTPVELFALVRGEQHISRGFVGVADFGRWRLICMPGPPTLDGFVNATPALPASSSSVGRGNACRVNQEMPAPSQSAAQNQGTPLVVVAANFSLVGPKRTPAAMLRLPPTAKTGDIISLRFDDGSMIETRVRDCAATECFAAGTFSGDEWQHLSATNTLQVRFPVMDRQWVILDLPIQGLSAAIGALGRAEVPATR